MSTLFRRGSRGPYVKDIQLALNEKVKPSPGLVPDGIFGGLTDAAVRAFQRMEKLGIDGIVGPITIGVLMMTKQTYIPIFHNLPFIPQPNKVTCWAAATAMMKRSTVQAVIAKTPADMIGSSGGLKSHSKGQDHVTGNRAYARVHGFRYHAPQSHSVAGFRNILRTSPIMLMMLWRPGTFAQGLGSPGHMVVVVGMSGDDDPTGKGTILTIYDPWKPNVGNRERVTYFKKANDTPLFTYGMFTNN